MLSILNIIPKPWPTIVILDLGAMSLGEITPSYQRLSDMGLCRIIGFEPVASECEKLNQDASHERTYLPYAIGDGNLGELRVCNFPMTSSLYEPNEALCSKFQNLAELMQVVERIPLQTRRLDDIKELADVDYVKMDIQGAELDAIRGGQRVISNALVIESEVEFVPLYKGQPLFADVDSALRDLGFLFHQFSGIAGRAFKPLIVNQDVNAMPSQALWSDAVYAKSFMRLSEIDPVRLLKMAIILHEAYGSFDLCHHILAHYDKEQATSLAPAYFNLLTSTNPGA